MDIKKITFYKTDWLEKVRGAKRLCSIEFRNGIIFRDVLLIESKDDHLYIKFPSAVIKGEDGNRKYYSVINCTDDALYEEIKSAVIDQWRRFTEHWKRDEYKDA